MTVIEINPQEWEGLLRRAFPQVAAAVYLRGFTMSYFLPQSSATLADIHTLLLRTYIHGYLDETRNN